MGEAVTFIPGDGIGPEVTAEAKKCVDTLIAVEWREASAGAAAEEHTGEPLPQETLDMIAETGVALKGPCTTPIGSGYRSVNVAMRQHFDLYANVRPLTYREGVPSRITNPEHIDLVIVRENTEGLYAGIEFREDCNGDTPLLDFVEQEKGIQLECDTGISLKPVSRRAADRVIRYAFDYAQRHDRGSVAASDKANILKESDGLFMETAQDVAENYPSMDYEHVLIDALCMQLVQQPERFDVLVLPNLYGDIVSDLAAGLVGGLGFAPSMNIGEDHAIFEAVHGTAPDIAGENIANPSAAILSAALMLEHLGYEDEADQLEDAVNTVIASGDYKTADVDPDDAVSTQTFGDAVRNQF